MRAKRWSSGVADALRACSLAALMLVGAARATFAADPEKPGEPPLDVAYFETATVEGRPVERVTASITVLDREAIAALGALSVAELLRHVPGLDVVSSGSRGSTAAAQIRGGDPNFSYVLVDGIPLNDPTDQFGGAVNLNALPLAAVERIEVVRGPLSSSFGSSGLAGAINIITRRGSAERRRAEARIGVGNASSLRGHVSLGGGSDQVDHFVAATWERERERIAEDSFEQLALQGNAGFDLVSAGALRVHGRVATWETEDYPDASGGPVFGSGDLRSSEHDELQLGVDWQFGVTRQRDRLRLALHRHRLDRDSPGVAPVVPPFLERTTFTRWQLGWSRPVAMRSGLRIDVGAGLDREHGDSDSELLLPPEFGGNIDGSYDVSRTTPGVFVEAVAERGRWLFEAGARVDDPEDESLQFSPRVGVAWRLPGEATRLRLSAGRAYKLPSFFAQASPAALGGNPELVPEIAVGADLGLEHTFTGTRLTTTVSVFSYRYSDLIDFDFDTFLHVNRDKVRARGVEWSVDWRLAESLSLQSSLTRQDVDNLGDEAPIRQRPDWVGGLRLAWRSGDRWTWLVDAQGVSQRFDQQIPLPARETVAGYALWGTALRYRFPSHWELQARVDNLADREYEAAIGFPGAGRAVRLDLAWR